MTNWGRLRPFKGNLCCLAVTSSAVDYLPDSIPVDVSTVQSLHFSAVISSTRRNPHASADRTRNSRAFQPTTRGTALPNIGRWGNRAARTGGCTWRRPHFGVT